MNKGLNTERINNDWREKSMEKIDLKQYLQKTVIKRYFVKGTLTNIHGEHSERPLGDEKQTTVHTFPKDKEDNLLVPLGGERGYIMGALRYALYDLYKDKLKNKEWKGYGIVSMLEHGVFITPKWIAVGKKVSNSLDKPKKYLVQAKGKARGTFPIYYDFIERVNFSVTIDITNPQIPEKIFLSLLAHIQRLGIGPKRRAKIQFTNIEKRK